PRTSARPGARLEDRPDPTRKTLAQSDPITPLAVPPRVVSRPRYPVPPTQAGYAKSVLLRIDEDEDGCLRAEQNRMAFFRSSCSSLSNAYRRLSADNCVISRLSRASGVIAIRARRRPSRASLRQRVSIIG